LRDKNIHKITANDSCVHHDFQIITRFREDSVFSYVVMVAKEVPIEPVMKVELQSGAQNLSEVVITAMGIPQIYDNIEEFFDLSTTWNNSLNIAQALDRGSYSFSLGSTTQE